MRWHEIVEDRVDELFDSNATYMWTTQQQDMWRASFRLNGQDFKFIAMQQDAEDDIWEIMYRVVGQPNGYDPTGVARENASKILSTVLTIATDFVKHRKPAQIDFSGKKNSGLGSLYERMLKHLAGKVKALGYVDASDEYDASVQNGDNSDESNMFALVRNDVADQLGVQGRVREQQLDELFNSSASIRWISNDDKEWTGRFSVDQMQFEINITNDDTTEKEWGVGYRVLATKNGPVDFDDGWQPTGVAGPMASKILGSVIAGIEQFIQEMQPTTLFFVGDKDNGLQDLYHKVIHALSSRLTKHGFTNATRSGSSYFTLVKNQQNEGNSMRWEEIVENEFNNVLWSNQNSARWSGMMKVNDQRFMMDFKKAQGPWWTFSFTMEGKDGPQVFGLNDFNGIRAFKLVNPAAKAVMEFINTVKPENLLLSVSQASGVNDIVSAVKGSLPQGYEVQPVSRMAPAGSFAIVRPEKRHDDARIERNTPLNQRGVR